ncbi:hypothetical protein F5Y10DRAFT_258594 [Nemania abortiva]|nr:hypothetical protein F5Y10DRAFT_258594 [Nemania abortiva]
MRMEIRGKDRRIEEQQAEESRRKKKEAELQQKRKAKEQEEAQRAAIDDRIRQMEADFEKKLEIISKAMNRREQTADLHGILSNSLPPQSARPYGHGYGHNAQEKYAYDMSMIMARLDSLAASERQAPPTRWFDGQGPPVRYHNDRPLIEDLHHQIDDLKGNLHEYRQMISRLLPYHQSENPFTDREYHPSYGPGHPAFQSPYSFATGNGYNRPAPPRIFRRPRGPPAGGPRGRGPSPAPVYMGVEEPAENVGPQRKNYHHRRFFYHNNNDYSDDEVSVPAAVAGPFVNGNRQVAENRSRKARKQRLSSHEKPEANGNNHAMGVPTYGSNSLAARPIETHGEESSLDSPHSCDSSDGMEEYKRRSSQYVIRPDSRFRREEFQADSAEDHSPRPLAPSPPLRVHRE